MRLDNKIRKLTSQGLYSQFVDFHKNFKPGTWTIAMFEGSPANGLYSWCPDCIVASTHVRRFEERKLGSQDIKLQNFRVGSRIEWESKSKLNPFRIRFPFLSDVPTAILFFGKLDVIRIIAPQEIDLVQMMKRTRVYENQIKSQHWRPPLRFAKKN
jgi:hypothetical protein